MRLCLVLCGFCALIALSGARLSAQTVTVDYLEGRASQKTTADWAELSVGDTIPVDGSVKLEKHSLVQFKAGATAITLSRPGTYAIRRLLDTRASLRAAGAPQALAVAFSRIVRGSPERLDEAGGIRAEKMPVPEGLGIGVEAPTPTGMVDLPYLELGKRQIASGEYKEAIVSLLEAVHEIGPGDTREARFYLATAYSLSGDALRALGALSGFAPGGTEDWAPDFILLRAKLLEDTFAFTEATDLLLKQGGSFAADERRAPMYFFLLALAYRGNDDAARQNLCLDKVVSLAGETDLGVTAARLRGLP
jgi:hypothetical protein